MDIFAGARTPHPCGVAPLIRRQKTAVDGYGLAIDERGGLGAEPQHGPGNLVRLAYTAHGVGAIHLLHQGVRIRRLMHQVGDDWRVDCARADRIDTDAARGVDESCGFREPDDRVLGRAVQGAALGTHQPGRGCGVDNCPSPAALHRGHLVLHAQPDPSDIHVDQPIEDLDGVVEGRSLGPGEASIVECAVKSTERGQCLVHHVDNRVFVRDISTDERRRASEPFDRADRLPPPNGLNVDDDDPRAGRGEGERSSAPDARAGAGNKRDLVREQVPVNRIVE